MNNRQQAVSVHTPVLDNGGRVGLNAADVEMYTLWSFVVELVQNTRDAISRLFQRERRPATVRFRRVPLDRDEIPGIDGIVRNLRQCRKSFGTDEKCVEFLDDAIESLSGRKVDCLLVSDYGTTGVPGSDHGQKSKWCGITRSRGVSLKEPGAGGSYGIGKASALRASRARFVFFSTLTEQGERKMLGTASVTTFQDAEKPDPEAPHTHQNTWFVGGERGASITDPDLMPRILAERTEPGLDVLIVGFDFGEGDKWMDEIEREMSAKFWPAVHNGAIRCEVVDGKKTASVERDNILKVLQRHGGDPLLYYKAYTSGKKRSHKTDLLGESSTYVLPTAAGNNKFATIRSRGMVIEEITIGSERNYAGVFECLDPDGDEILRSMEPPTHDKWDTKRIPEGKTVSKEFRGAMRAAVADVNDSRNDTLEQVVGLENFLPMYDEGRRRTPRPPEVATVEEKKEKATKNPFTKGFNTVALVARAVKASGGEYTLVVEHDAEEDAMIAFRLAGEEGDEQEFMEVAYASKNRRLRVSSKNVVGPVALAKGPNRINLRLAEKGRVSIKVFQVLPKEKKS